MEIVGSEIFWNGIGSGFSGEQSVSPIEISEMPDICHNRTDCRLFYFNFFQTVEFIQLADLYFLHAALDCASPD